MTKDDIFAMAKKAHLGVTLAHDGVLGQFIEGANWTEELVAFAKLVAEAEREACAKLIQPNEEHRKDASWGYLGGVEGVELLDNAAEKIKNRGEI